ncbi:MAG: flagellin [Candidatus Hydrogenedentota bacterium]
MAFRVNSNIPALFAQRQLTITNFKVQKNIERLSSGYRINRAADDAAGLAVSEKLRTQINGIKQARLNVQDGISLIQTAEGGLQEIQDNLHRLRVLAIQSANDILTTVDRYLIQLEFNQVLDEIDRAASSVQFNTKQLLRGAYSLDMVSNPSGTNNTYPGSLVLHVGANANDTIAIHIPSISTAALGTVHGQFSSPSGIKISSLRVDNVTGYNTRLSILAANAGVMTRRAAESAIGIITSGINMVSEVRANLGACQNRLESTFNFLGVVLENITSSESRIRDVDVSAEVVDFTKNQILVQTGTAALAQANVAPQTVLQLLQ